MWDIMHTADVHLDRWGDWTDQMRCLAALEAEAMARRPDVLAITGDLVAPKGARRQHQDERNAWRGLLGRVGASGVEVVVVLGNHDVRGDMAHLADLPGVRFVEDPEIISFTDPFKGNLLLYCLPYPEPAIWLDGADVPEGQRIGETERRVEAQLRAWAQDGRDGARVALVHCALRGAPMQLGPSQPKVGHEPKISIEAFIGFDAALVGHYHLAQVHHPDDRTVVAYAGSPWPHTHNEEGQADKGVLLWRVSASERATYQRIRLPFTPRLTLRLAWQDHAVRWPDGAPWKGIPDVPPHPGVPSRAELDGAVVRVVVEYPKGSATAIDRDHIKAQVEAAGARTCRVLPKPVSEARVSVPAFAAGRIAATLRGQLEAMWDATGGAPEGYDPAWVADACSRLETTVAEAA